MAEELLKRPNFIRILELKTLYGCAICSEIILQPHQTLCGSRVCKKCIEDKFGDRDVIPCPLSHDDLDEKELEEEPCQKQGLKREFVVPDPGSQKSLLKEKCFCENHQHGCCENPQWKKLEKHQEKCTFAQPKYLKNTDNYLSLKENQDRQADRQISKRKSSQCQFCRRLFEQHIVIHQKISPACLLNAGKCYYYEYCGYESSDIERLQTHMETSSQLHLDSQTSKLNDLQKTAQRARDKSKIKVQKIANSEIHPNEKTIAKLAMQVKRLTEEKNLSDTTGDQLVDAMRGVSHRREEVEIIENDLDLIRGQIQKQKTDDVLVAVAITEADRRQNHEMEMVKEKMEDLELCSYDGTLIWRIKDYKQKKSDAISGRRPSIISHHFYTSKCGYKMCCQAYLNGDGLGRAKCLSLFFVLMKGEYDELLHFPFKQRVAFSLLSPSNPSMSKHETFLPDPESSSFKRPQTEMNIASGCPQFASHEEVESSSFLGGDSIYVRVRVEPNEVHG